MNKLYISDLDGTLLQPNAILSDKTKTVLNDLIDQGMHFTIATARSIASAKTILKDVKISIPIILMNGVCIYDLIKNEYLNVEAFSKKSLDILMDIIKTNSLKGFAYTIKFGELATFYEDLNTKALQDFYKERVDSYQKRFYQIEDFTLLSNEPLIYFTLLDQRDRLEPIFHIIETFQDLNCAFYKDNYSPDLWYLEVYSKDASKSHALQILQNRLGFEYVTCFGDNHNDLPLFAASDYKIAVGNAVPALKEKADLVIGNNYDDGVAAWLKQNFLTQYQKTS